MNVKSLRVGKGKIASAKEHEWVIEYYELEVAIENPSEIEIARANLTGQIDGWLGKITAPQAYLWDPNKIRWEKAESRKGPYERSHDINNREFKAMLKDLAAHNGKLTRNGYFYWIFENGSTVGRKRRV